MRTTTIHRERTPHALRVLRALSGVLLIGLIPAAAVLLFSADGYRINRLNVQLWYLLSTPEIRAVTSPELYATVWNVLLFAVLFAALALWVPRWWTIAIGAAISTVVELFQWQLGSRQPSLGDVLANTAGTVLGVAVGIGLHRTVSQRGTGADPTQGPSGDGTASERNRAHVAD